VFVVQPVVRPFRAELHLSTNILFAEKRKPLIRNTQRIFRRSRKLCSASISARPLLFLTIPSAFSIHHSKFIIF
jgi:hypothetical protein